MFIAKLATTNTARPTTFCPVPARIVAWSREPSSPRPNTPARPPPLFTPPSIPDGPGTLVERATSGSPRRRSGCRRPRGRCASARRPGRATRSSGCGIRREHSRGNRSHDRRSLAWCAAHLEGATYCVAPIGPPLQACAERGRARIEPHAVVLHLETEPALVARCQAHDRTRCVRVLRHVLQGLETTEVDGCLDLLRVAVHPVGLDVHGDGSLARLRTKSRAEPLVGQERRVDPTREVAQRLERLVRLRLDLGEHQLGLRRISIHEGLRKALLHRERDQLLLRPVMDIALERLRSFVLRGDDPTTRLAQLLDQSDVSQHERGLRRDVFNQAHAIWTERLSGRHHADRAEELTTMSDRERPLPLGEGGKVDGATERYRGHRNVGGPYRRRSELRSHPEPHTSLRGLDALSQHTNETRQDVVGRIC